jgi:hypothetical protein
VAKDQGQGSPVPGNAAYERSGKERLLRVNARESIEVAIQGIADLTNVQFPIYNFHPKKRSSGAKAASSDKNWKLRIEH